MRSESWLKGLMVLVGISMLGAVVGILMPWGAMARTTEALGFSPLVYHPVTEYLARSLSGLYLLLGVMTLILVGCVPTAMRPVKGLFWCFLVYGLVAGAVNWWIQLPSWWVLGEMASLVPTGVVGLWLCRRCPQR